MNAVNSKYSARSATQKAAQEQIMLFLLTEASRA